MDNDKIRKILDELRIENYYINSDGIVNVIGDVYISYKDLKTIPVKFGIVKGYFWCDYNQLISLEGCPEEVKGSFNCYNNRLTSLEGCPEKVGGNFWCFNNILTSLERCPKEIGEDFWCNNNPITSLGNFDPESVSGEIFGIDFKKLDVSKLTLKQKKWIIEEL